MRKGLLRVELCAWGVGLLGLSALLGFRVEASRAEQTALHLGTVSFSATPSNGAQSAQSSDPLASPDLSSGNGVIGRLEIRTLGLSVPILNNYDPASLRRGVGRIQGTAVPGGLGNFVVAGHRDTYFRPLRRIEKGMTMHVVAATGTYDYIVDSTQIVLPSDVDVLDVGDTPQMTLITCYPFNFIGAAPKRFIVRGHLVSVAGDPQ